MTEGQWGLVIGGVMMVAIAPFALRGFAVRWKKLTGHRTDD